MTAWPRLQRQLGRSLEPGPKEAPSLRKERLGEPRATAGLDVKIVIPAGKVRGFEKLAPAEIKMASASAQAAV